MIHPSNRTRFERLANVIGLYLYEHKQTLVSQDVAAAEDFVPYIDHCCSEIFELDCRVCGHNYAELIAWWQQLADETKHVIVHLWICHRLQLLFAPTQPLSVELYGAREYTGVDGDPQNAHNTPQPNGTAVYVRQTLEDNNGTNFDIEGCLELGSATLEQASAMLAQKIFNVLTHAE